jgi:hypothetical protein
MKKIVIVCGLIAGIIVTSMMVITIALCYRSGNFEGNMTLGYATMLLAFSLIFIGIKNYRDKYHGGIITFGKAFKTGFYISLIASTMYVAAWLIMYYLFIPDFMEKYSDHVVREAKTNGASQLEINKKVTEMASFKEMYKNPLLVVLLTYSEILPVGLIVTLISSLLLKRKINHQAQIA